LKSKMGQQFLLLCLTLCLSYFTTSLSAGTIRPPRSGAEQNCNLILEGVIESGDSLMISHQLPEWAEDGEFILCLISPGGNLSEAVRIAELLQERGIATFIPDQNECLSACAIAFLGGLCQATGDSGVYSNPCRFLGRGSVIGFHAPFIQALEETRSETFSAREVRELWQVSSLATGYYAAALTRFGVPMDTILRFLSTSADEFSVVSSVGEARLMRIIATNLEQIELGPELFVETCGNALRSPEQAIADLRAEDSSFHLQYLESRGALIIIATQLSFVNFPYATWQVCRLNYHRTGSGIHPAAFRSSGSILVEACGRVVVEIPDSLEISAPRFQINVSGEAVVVDQTIHQDSCALYQEYTGAEAQMWLRRSETLLSNL
jgi:hypothetical protein